MMSHIFPCNSDKNKATDEKYTSNEGKFYTFIHSGPKWQISFRNCSWGYNAQIWHFCIPLAFLGAKDSKKIVKGRRRSERPNQRPGTEEVKF